MTLGKYPVVKTPTLHRRILWYILLPIMPVMVLIAFIGFICGGFVLGLDEWSKGEK